MLKNEYYRLRNNYVERYFNTVTQTNEIMYKELVRKCVQAIRHYLVEDKTTLKRFFENEVMPKLRKKSCKIGYKSFVKYLDIIQNFDKTGDDKTGDNQIKVSNILVECVFENIKIMDEILMRLKGVEKTIFFYQPLENYNRYIAERKKYKEMYNF